MMTDPTVATENSNWFVTSMGSLIAGGGFLIRWLIGRHTKAFDTVCARLDNIEQDVAYIKGRFSERDRHGETWPGDRD